MVEIDGSMGEGGGQVLRTALSLSALTGKPLVITNIRAGREHPGLLSQHLTAVDAAAAICKAEVQGARLGSRRLTFEPQAVHSGRYQFEIKTAGSTSLVLQTIFLPLSHAGSSSSIVITGGTHVPWAPSFHYLDMQWLPSLRTMGWEARLDLDLAGFYPQGGGKISSTVRPVGTIMPLNLTRRGTLRAVTGVCAIANLDRSIAERMKRQARLRLVKFFQGNPSLEIHIKIQELQSPSKGAFIILAAECENGRGCFTALGEPGKPAERVADEAIDAICQYADSDAAVDPYLADQLLLPMALANGVSRLTTAHITMHLITNVEVIRRFLPAHIEISGDVGKPGQIQVVPSTETA
jgi:RNA 3'-terminal phosphate cyclase (ATP)